MEMSDRYVSLFQDLVCSKSGIYMEDDHFGILRDGLQARMESNGFANHAQYYEYLHYHPAGQQELDELLSHITVNETYFFRNAAHFSALRNHILVKLARESADKTIKIWSAGCSTGEEPYSIAMTLLDLLQAHGDLQIEILGTDVDRKAITKAERGIYRKRALHATADRYIEKYFRAKDDGFEIHQSLRDMVNFEYFNLMDSSYPKPSQGYWDVIVCRNVLIYFDQASTCRVVGMFHKALDNDGYLLIGHSETMERFSDDFSPIILDDAFVYVKKANETNKICEAIELPKPKSALKKSFKQKSRKNALRMERRQLEKQNRRAKNNDESVQAMDDVELAYNEGLDLFEREEFDAALDKVRKHISSKPTAVKGYLLAGKIYANRGDYESAVGELDKSIKLDPLLTEAHYLLGVVYQGTGQMTKAIDEYRKSIYIDRSCALSYFNLARIYQSNGISEDALREYSNALGILEKLNDDEIVEFSGGITARILTQICSDNIAEISNDRQESILSVSPA